MPRPNSITMSLPPFSGAVRTLIIANVAVFFALAILHWILPAPGALLTLHLVLIPGAVVRGEVWQLATYSFIQSGILDILFAMLTLWFCGVMLEASYGSRWVMELYFTGVVGGALLATAIAFTGLFHISPAAIGAGAWAGIFALLIAIGVRFGDDEFLLWFTVRVRAKYMVAIYILIAVAILLKDANAFGALLQLAGGLFGYLYVKFAPRRGLAFGMTEQVFGVRNAWYRAKRRRAAKKFEVYMSKQGRQVRFDEEGRYVDPDSTRRPGVQRDPSDRRWMN